MVGARDRDRGALGRSGRRRRSRLVPRLLVLGALQLVGFQAVELSAQEQPQATTPTLSIETPENEQQGPTQDAMAGEPSPPETSAAVASARSGAAVVAGVDPALEGEPIELFIEANQAYAEGRYGAAIALYQQPIARGRNRAAIHYNLGNAYLRSGDLGRAIASFLAASTRSPRDQDIAANLDFARSLRRDALVPPAPSAVARTLFFWRYAFARHETLRGAALASLLLFALLLAVRRRPAVEPLRWGAWVIAVVLAALLAALVAMTLTPSVVAVVLPPEVEVRSGNDPATVVRFVLHSGAEVRVLESRAGWVRIRLPDGEQGWLEQEHVAVIEG